VTVPAVSDADVERIVRDEYARVVATLVRRFGDVDLAEEAIGEALLIAVRSWRRDGLPPNPGGWLVTTAGNRAIDRIRRESVRDARQKEALVLTPGSTDPLGAVDDDRLRLIFMCCHPALSVEARVALTLRLVAGLSMAEIAQAFLVPETTMAQRLTRAKRKIKGARIPFGVPFAQDLPARVSSVAAVIYLVFNQGYLATTGDAPIREELCAEAVRLARLLRRLLPDEPEVAGLLALLLLTDARRPARFDDEGTLVPLAEQDRGRWIRPLIVEGHDLVRECLRKQRPGYYQILAAINAVHTDGPATDWRQVLALYDQLLTVAPSPVVRLNRAVAVAEVEGPAAALAEVDALDLVPYHAWHATRADLLRRLDRPAEAAQAYDAAIALADNTGQQTFLSRRRAALPD